MPKQLLLFRRLVHERQAIEQVQQALQHDFDIFQLNLAKRDKAIRARFWQKRERLTPVSSAFLN